MRTLGKISLFCVVVVGANLVFGQDYPYKPIRIVTSAIGGGTDAVARPIAQGISEPLRQPVVVDNRGSSIITGAIVSKAPADGYTLIVASSFWNLSLMQKVPFDPVKDFAPITLATTEPNVLAVHPSVAATSVKELIALAKARPGGLNYSSGPTGGTAHLAGELFKSMAGLNIVRIAYKGGAAANTALISGEVQLTFGSASSVTPYMKAGKLRALAVTSAESSALVPGLPTVAASGLPGYEAANVNGVFAPAQTPATIIDRLNREIVRFLSRDDVKERFLHSGSEVIASSPQQLATTVKSEMTRIGKVIKEANIRIE